jgi:hypothetical protein
MDLNLGGQLAFDHRWWAKPSPRGLQSRARLALPDLRSAVTSAHARIPIPATFWPRCLAPLEPGQGTAK